MSPVISRTIASALGVAAFIVAIVAGLAVGNDPARILTAALLSMVLCQLLGLAIGAAWQHIVTEHLASNAGASGGPSAVRSSGTSENPQVIHNG